MEKLSISQFAPTGVSGQGSQITFFCDLIDNASEITNAVAQENVSGKLVLLLVSINATTKTIRTVVDAMAVLDAGNTNAIVGLILPAETDGTDIYKTESTHIHKALATTEKLKGLRKTWLITLSDDSVWQLDSVISVAREKQIPVLVKHGDEPMSDNAQLFAWDFVTYNLLQESRQLYGTATIVYLEALQNALYHNQLCHRNSAARSNDDLDKLLTGALAERTTDGAAKPDVSIKDVLEMAFQLGRAHLHAFRSHSSTRNTPGQLSNALLVGAYGGEHIGDIAILGGVLERLHNEFGLVNAVLMTQRPNHTRHLIPMLDTPVSIRVEKYTFANIDKQLANSDALVHAGGPLTDIPKQLVRHLYAAAIAKRSGKPYLLEGIGPTTFKRTASRVTARRLVKLADRVVVRTQQDANAKIIREQNVSTGRDPAFDYLETLSDKLTGFLPGENIDLDNLLKATEGRPVIGINIRPINDLFTPSVAGMDRASYTQTVEEKMESNLAKGIEQFSLGNPVKPVFIFFPMNAIQFGKSDNRSAYRIARHLSPDIDARFWHKDASLNAVVTLIRRMDTMISMRFHATIFALSQNCRPIGIDYRIGMKYKVSAVMEDAGEAEFCCRIDEVESDWIAERLTARLKSSVIENQ